MKSLLPPSIRLTVPLILFGFVLALSALYLMYQVPRAEAAVETDHRERVLQEMSRLQSTLEYLLGKDDIEGAQREVAMLASNRDNVFVAMTDDHHTVIAATRRGWFGRPASEVLPKFDALQVTNIAQSGGVQVVHEPGALLAHADVRLPSGNELRGSRVGRLFLEYDLKRAKAAAGRQVVAQSLYWIVWVTVLAVVSWIIFHLVVTGRTDKLVRAAEQLAAGDLTARSGLRGRDEFARLSRAFDAMADEVVRTQTRLQSDIAARTQVQQALLASEEQYRAMFDASIDGLVLWNAEGEIVEINDAVWRMYGIAPEERSTREQVAGALNRPAVAEFLELVANGKPFHIEMSDDRRDGSALEMEVHGIPMQYQGAPHLLAISRDITEKKRAASEFAQQREVMHQREKLAALGSLLAGVAHELNNPLSVVVARAAILEERDDPATRETASKIRAAAERCARIVRTFLAMARQQQPQRVPVDLAEVVSAALDLTGYALKTSGIDVTLDLCEETPPVLADADQLHQVFMNLIINAQQAVQDQIPPRKLTITSRYDRTANTIRVAVADNGPGIPEAVRQRIFEPYFTTKPLGTGTGVGLAVCLGIVEAHGGTLTVESGAGGGAVFTIVLPVASTGGDDSAESESHLAKRGQHSALVVDDEVEVRETLADILINAGHRVVTAASGHEALERMVEERFSVVLTDIRMPDLDGRTLYREIERRWPERAAQVIFVTGDTLTSALRSFAQESGCRVIEKPFLPIEVRRIVDETLAATLTPTAPVASVRHTHSLGSDVGVTPSIAVGEF